MVRSLHVLLALKQFQCYFSDCSATLPCWKTLFWIFPPRRTEKWKLFFETLVSFAAFCSLSRLLKALPLLFAAYFFRKKLINLLKLAKFCIWKVMFYHQSKMATIVPFLQIRQPCFAKTLKAFTSHFRKNLLQVKACK